jgi:hypothetical protein
MLSEERRKKMNQASLKWYYAHREHAIAKAKQWAKNNPERAREISRKSHRGKGRLWLKANREKARGYTRRYMRKKNGVKNATAESKHGACEICGTVRQLQFDHDHATGLFRGWLCRKCNLAIGYLNDDWQIVSKAVDYLKRSSVQTGTF